MRDQTVSAFVVPRGGLRRRVRRRRRVVLQNQTVPSNVLYGGVTRGFARNNTPGRMMRNVLRNERRNGARRLRAIEEAAVVKSMPGMPGSKASFAVGPATQIAKTWTNNSASGKADGIASMSLGTTLVGRLASAKALHPAGDVGPQCWPDKAANETVVLQNTDVFIVTKNGNATAEGETWNCQMWLTNFIDCPLISTSVDSATGNRNPNDEMNNSNTGPGQTVGTNYSFWYSSQWNTSDPEKHPNKDFQTARITGRSITVDLISNATTNQGMVYSSQFTPNLALMPEVGGPAITELITKLATLTFDKMIRERCLKDEGEAELSAEDTDESDGIEWCSKLIGKHLLSGLDAPSGDQSGYRLVFQDFPWTIQQVMQNSPMNYMAKAEEGVYMPLKHASDTIPYAPTSVECYLSAVVPHTSDSQTTEMNVLRSEGWNMGAIFFAGLHNQATLSVKIITTLEMTARSDSQMAKFVREAPPLDKVAIDHTRAAMGNMPDAFPACDNALGGIADWIAAALEKAGGGR